MQQKGKKSCNKGQGNKKIGSRWCIPKKREGGRAAGQGDRWFWTLKKNPVHHTCALKLLCLWSTVPVVHQNWSSQFIVNINLYVLAVIVIDTDKTNWIEISSWLWAPLTNYFKFNHCIIHHIRSIQNIQIKKKSTLLWPTTIQFKGCARATLLGASCCAFRSPKLWLAVSCRHEDFLLPLVLSERLPRSALLSLLLLPHPFCRASCRHLVSSKPAVGNA